MTLSKKVWTLADAIPLCTHLEMIAVQYECHIGLTGGLLYKDGPRKDLDVVVYRRGMYKGETELPPYNRTELIEAFSKVVTIEGEFTRVVKASYKGKPVDLLFVNDRGEYDDTSSTTTDKSR